MRKILNHTLSKVARPLSFSISLEGKVSVFKRDACGDRVIIQVGFLFVFFVITNGHDFLKFLVPRETAQDHVVFEFVLRGLNMAESESEVTLP